MTDTPVVPSEARMYWMRLQGQGTATDTVTMTDMSGVPGWIPVMTVPRVTDQAKALGALYAKLREAVAAYDGDYFSHHRGRELRDTLAALLAESTTTEGA